MVATLETEVKERTPRTYADLLALYEAAPVWKRPDKGEVVPGMESEGRPQVMLGTDEFRIANEVIDGLAELGWKPGHNPANRIYQRQGRLVQVVRSPAVDVCGVRLPDGTLRIRPLPRSIIRERIGQAVLLVVEGPEGLDVKRPPDWLATVVLDRGQYPAGIRDLAGIVRSPTLRPDGSVLQDPGYDEDTGLLYAPDGEYPRVESRPSREAARRAADELLHVVVDVPFAGPQHRSVWLAGVLTLAARSAIPGCCPVFVFDANAPGSGKSLAVDAASTIIFDTHLPRKTWTADDNELRKTITAVLLEGVPAVNFDNVADVFGSPSLDAVTTGTTWSDRVLGTNQMTGDLPATTVWFATGNNVVIGADTARRVLYARIESPEENPEDRTGFTHENLPGWVRQNRHRLAVAAITMLRGYVAAGRPSQKLVPWGSFEAWSNLVRSTIVWAGLLDPCSTRAIVREKDRSAELLRLFLDGIKEMDLGGEGVTSADIKRLLERPIGQDGVDVYPSMRAAVAESCEKLTARAIGYALRKYIGRVCGGRRIVAEKGHAKITSWLVEDVLSGGDGGDGGDVSSARGVNRKTCVSENGGEKREKALGERQSSPPSPPSPPCDHDFDESPIEPEGIRSRCRKCELVIEYKPEQDQPSNEERDE